MGCCVVSKQQLPVAPWRPTAADLLALNIWLWLVDIGAYLQRAVSAGSSSTKATFRYYYRYGYGYGVLPLKHQIRAHQPIFKVLNFVVIMLKKY